MANVKGRAKHGPAMDRTHVWVRVGSLPRVWVEELQRREERAGFWHGKDAEADPDWLSKIAVVLTDAALPDSLIDRLPSLRWVQFTRGTAYELMEPALRDGPVNVSVIKGIDGVQFSEFAMGAILLWAKHFPSFYQAQQKKRWERHMPLEISGMTLGILGLGTIGCAVARKGKAFGMRVIGIKRTRVPKPDYVDELWTPERLTDLLGRSDFLVISIPSIPETFGLIGPEELRGMKKTAYLINLTGGYAIEEETLIQALQENWIAGAALDALPRQPLPPDSGLWGLANVVITPRIAGYTPNRWNRLIPVFQDNLSRFLSGKQIPIIDKMVGM